MLSEILSGKKTYTSVALGLLGGLVVGYLTDWDTEAMRTCFEAGLLSGLAGLRSALKTEVAKAPKEEAAPQG